MKLIPLRSRWTLCQGAVLDDSCSHQRPSPRRVVWMRIYVRLGNPLHFAFEVKIIYDEPVNFYCHMFSPNGTYRRHSMDIWTSFFQPSGWISSIQLPTAGSYPSRLVVIFIYHFQTIHDHLKNNKPWAAGYSWCFSPPARWGSLVFKWTSHNTPKLTHLHTPSHTPSHTHTHTHTPTHTHTHTERARARAQTYPPRNTNSLPALWASTDPNLLPDRMSNRLPHRMQNKCKITSYTHLHWETSHREVRFKY